MANMDAVTLTSRQGPARWRQHACPNPYCRKAATATAPRTTTLRNVQPTQIRNATSSISYIQLAGALLLCKNTGAQTKQLPPKYHSSTTVTVHPVAAILQPHLCHPRRQQAHPHRAKHPNKWPKATANPTTPPLLSAASWAASS